MKELTCQVVSITPLTDFVHKVLLKPDAKAEFEAGQYLNVVMGEEDKRPFSIASAPESEYLELQIGAFGADGYAMQVIDKLKSESEIKVEVGLGAAQLREESDRPLLLIAGGTGFSYIKSIFEHLAATNSTRKVIVYWGLRQTDASFELKRTMDTLGQLNEADFNLVIENPGEGWEGKTGMVHKVVMDDIDNLGDFDIYLAGRFDMVGAVRTDFVAKGADVERMFADAFAFI